jgi:glycosyltransferase involved in cell wall biosynthesis
MISQKVVSIIISAYNAEKYLTATLDSVFKQTYKNIEVVVVNDGSTDNTLAIAKLYETQGVKIISQQNKGQDAALNNGYKNSKGEYIKFMDSDDIINPTMIELQVKALESADEFIAYGEWARFYNDKPSDANFAKLDYWKDMKPLDFLTARPEGVMLQCGIMLLPRKIIDKAGLWDERLILYNDTEFFNRILLKSKGVKFTEGARLYYRSALSGSISAQTTKKYFESTFLATNLIAQQLLPVEDSYRIRNLISNTFLNQYYRMYPHFPDLIKKHEEKIKWYGSGTVKPDGGKVFKLLKKILGWKMAKRIQLLFYKIGYKPNQISSES